MRNARMGIAIFVFASVLAFVVLFTLSGSLQESLRAVTGQASVQTAGTPIYLPNLPSQPNDNQLQSAEQALEESEVINEATAEVATPQVETDLPPEAFNTPIPYTPAPLPPLSNENAQLSHIAFENLQLIKIPVELHPSFGVYAWSNDSKQYLATLPTDEVIRIGDLGRYVQNVYIGNAMTNEITLWQTNADYPAWSKDGQSVYYIAMRSDGLDWQYDLYRRNASSNEAELIASEVSRPNTLHPAALELDTGELMLFDADLQPALLQQGLAQPTKLVEHELIPLRSLTEGTEPLSAAQEVNFSVAPNGRVAVLLSQQPPTYLVDIEKREQIGALNGAIYYSNYVAWTQDSQSLAYATRDGVFVYNLLSGETTTIVTRADLKLNPHESRSGFASPVWSPDEQLLLFTAFSGDWNFQINEPRPHFYPLLFVATRDGLIREVVGDQTIYSLAPDGARAIIKIWNADAQRFEKYLASVVWNQ
jgi:hypothetical protein